MRDRDEDALTCGAPPADVRPILNERGELIGAERVDGTTASNQVTRAERLAAAPLRRGMGPAKLALQARKQYGVIMTVEEAKRLREAWFATWPEAHSYLRKWVPAQLSGPDGEETGEGRRRVVSRLGDAKFLAEARK